MSSSPSKKFFVPTNPLVRVFAAVSFVYGLLAFVALTLIFAPLAFIVSFGPNARKGSERAYFVIYLWSVVFAWLIFTRFRVHRTEAFEKQLAASLDGSSPYIYIVNHGSYLDAIAVAHTFPRNYRPLGKIEFSKVPIFGAMYRRTVIMVDRSSKESRGESLNVLRESLKGGMSVLIFPEGTMNKTEALLQPFKMGAFRIASESGLPLVPSVIRGARERMPRTQFFFLKPFGTIDVFFGDPIEVKTGEDVEALAARAHARMEGMLRG